MRGHARRDRDRSRIFGVGMGLLALAGLPACAQFSGPPSELEQIVVTQQQQIQLQARALEALRREVAGLREAVTASTGVMAFTAFWACSAEAKPCRVSAPCRWEAALALRRVASALRPCLPPAAAERQPLYMTPLESPLD